jgi:hypothetical protein
LEDLQPVVDEYNQLLVQGREFAPELRVASSSGSGVNVVVEVAAAAYCGKIDVSQKPFQVTIISATDARCVAANIGSVSSTLRHELTQALGWVDQAEQYAVKQGGVGVSDNCSLALPNAPKVLNPFVCLHDVEGIFRAYRNLPLADSGREYWSRPILQRSDLSATPRVLTAGSSTQLTITQFASDSPPSAYPVVVSRSASQAIWTSRHEQVATVSTSGVVTALSAGETRVVVRPDTSSLPAAMQVWSPFLLFGDSVNVTVAAPPAPPPLRIVDIATPEGPPIVREGLHQFSASWSGGNGSAPDSVRWQLDDTRTGPGIDVTIMVRGSLNLIRAIQGGSYSLQVTALPYQGGASGSAYAEDYPVCTEGGAGSSGTDADAGCGGGGGLE